MGSFDRGNRGGGRSFGGGGRSFSGGSDRRGGFGDRRGGDRGRGGFAGGDRTMHHAVCSNCGRDCEVPFLPTNNKPVYCSDCFEKMGNDRGSSQSVRPTNQPANSEQGKSQLDAINARLDGLNSKLEKILKLLEPEAAKPAAPSVSVGKAIKEAKPLKAKKVIKKTAAPAEEK